MDTRIKINVYTPGYSIKEIKVDKRAQIRDLRLVYHGLNVKFLHQGAILNESLSFEMCNIANGDTLVATSNLAAQNKWKRITSQPTLLKSMNVDMCKEMVRVTDLRKSMTENKPKKFRSMFMKMQKTIDAEEEKRYKNSKKFETVIGEPPKTICCEEIKVSWGSPVQQQQQGAQPNVLMQEDKVFGGEDVKAEKVF